MPAVLMPIGQISFLKNYSVDQENLLISWPTEGAFLEPCEKCENHTNRLPQAFD